MNARGVSARGVCWSIVVMLIVEPACIEPEVQTPQRQVSAWTLVWADDFDGPAGERPDPAKWGYDVGGGGWGNNELQHYTDRADNAAMDGEGHLIITARQEAFEGNTATSARLLTRDIFEFTYGRAEARLKLPRGAGLWPAFWMLGADYPTVGWPECGEIDIMEYRGQTTDVVHGSLHGPGFFGGNPITDAHFLEPGQSFDAEFHTFAVEWDPGRVAWFVDGQLFNLATTGQVPAGGRWVFDHPFFLILNMAVGGDFVGPPSADTPFPAELVVDYVRVYERAEPGR